MRARIAATLLLASALAGCAADLDYRTTSAVSEGAEQPRSIGIAGPAIRIETGDGLGSGIYIGNGILTAAHVVGDSKWVSIVTDAGGRFSAPVRWVNKDYDIAFLGMPPGNAVRSAQLDCALASAGTAVQITGNPLGISFFVTHGYVATVPEPRLPLWKEAFMLDMTTVGGMSGSGLVDDAGEVIGVVVGTIGISNQSPTGVMGVAVPSTVVCDLMGLS